MKKMKTKKKKKQANTIVFRILILLFICIGIVGMLLIKSSYDSHQLRHPPRITVPAGGMHHE